MKQFIFGVLILITTVSPAQSFKPVADQSSVKFTIKNFGFNVTGTLSGLNGDVQFDPADLSHASFDVTVDVSTINTGIDMRDNHLRSEDYFDVKNYPQIHFISTRVVNSKKAGTFIVYGNLTIKETTKEITIPFTAQPQTDGYLFTGEFKMNRRDFSIGGSGTISNDLKVKLEVVTKK
jgi:polyisoprenoid-binding protein YceI